jgi:aspartyl-tRNA(Asn)/glutamyl-tRNA(Gln) amidotransferase subunit C
MSLTRDDVEKVSLLARLALTPAELDLMTTQLTAVVGYVAQLKELDVTNVEPMAHAVPTANVFRADEPRATAGWSDASLAGAAEPGEADRAALLANAPHSDGEFYLVPAVLGE